MSEAVYGHPRKVTVERFTDGFHLSVARIYRTDEGDDETNQFGHSEWKHRRFPDDEPGDMIGDDDITITISPPGTAPD